MGDFKLTTVEEFEAATDRLLETGKKVGADAWQYRVKNQTPHCKFGETGICCRICAMGPCRITPKAPSFPLPRASQAEAIFPLPKTEIAEPRKMPNTKYGAICLNSTLK